jgi:predicted AlkP superfamily phosphohydrolase/phosphomutase
MRPKRVVVVGLDGLEPSIAEAMMLRGELPSLAGLRRSGGYARLATTLPAQTPVAWSSFAVGANPGAHGIFDFLHRDIATYRPDVALYRYEQKSRFLPPRAVNLRGGTPLWSRLTDAGIPASVLRHPCTYPPDSLRGRMLSGVGVPDIRGGFGTPSYYTDEETAPSGDGEHLVAVERDPQGGMALPLRGPKGPGGVDITLPLDIHVDESGGGVTITGQGIEDLSVRQGRWSDWLPVRFKLGTLQTVRGMVRFYLVGVSPLRLHATPIHFDPDAPVFPVSHPWDYAAELRRELGPYHTLGMAEEHAGLNNGRIGEEAFLAQCDQVVTERRAMLHYELDRLDEGFLFCLFDTPDRIQHMFWRYRDPEHPAHGGERPDPDRVRVIEDHYRVCDGIVGEVLERAGDDTLVMVASDHGFTDFRRALNLNTWLYRNGFLALKRGVQAGAGAGDLLKNVDWGRTRAFGLGMAGIYLNLKGREAEGIVEPSEAELVKADLAHRLAGLRDPVDGAVAVRAVHRRESVYRGEFVDRSPDLLASCAPGYRVSSTSAVGGVPYDVLVDNKERWSGDHVVDPDAVPGVLFMNQPFAVGSPRIVDLAPTVLATLGAPGGGEMEGRSLIP